MPFSAEASAVSGSPPHTRGKVVLLCFIHRDGGITPAHAGKRTVLFITLKIWGDHPRTRGEKEPFHLLPM